MLEAGGAEVLVDYKEFKAGRTVVGQMDGTQDGADRHVLCLSIDYVASAMCLHELGRAIAIDPEFQYGHVLPLRLDDAPLPPEIATPNPLWLDFRDTGKSKPWGLLLDGCGASLGTTAPAWLAARDAITAELTNRNSVNLVVLGNGIAAEELVYGLPELRLPDLAVVNLTDPATIPRAGLCLRILQAIGMRATALARKPNDLADIDAQPPSRPARPAQSTRT